MPEQTKTTTIITGKVQRDIHGSFSDCSLGLYVGNDRIEQIIEKYLGKTVRITIESVEV